MTQAICGFCGENVTREDEICAECQESLALVTNPEESNNY
jgi:predicted amidophosphoribosyltransferase